MILREVRKHADVKGQPGGAPLRKRMGGHLHHDAVTAAVRHLAEQRLQLIGIRCRVIGGQHLIPHHILDRPDQPDAVTCTL